MNLIHKIKQFLLSEDGPTPIEYGVMLALVVSICVTALTALVAWDR
ncbi:MAG: Flp family type IVb pilin [Planctomycetia bacterium]|nr:Flp family type IVb pilin [Planctomycetia bacterium]